MGAKSKHSPQRIAQAVKRYSKGEPVRTLAKEYKVSVPALYLWISKAKDAASAAEPLPSTTHSGGQPSAPQKQIPVSLRMQALEAENQRLRRKVLDLMLKHGEI